MVIRHFLKWIGSAKVAERAAAATALARAFLDHQLPFEDRCEAEAALTLLLDDPSPKVRAALAEALSMSSQAPAQIVAALAADQHDVAACILVRSPLLGDAELIDRVASSDGPIQALVASRPYVSMSLSAAIAEVGELEACLALVSNDGADIAQLTFRRLAERHGHEAALRERLLTNPRLPGDCRHTLLVKLGEALREAPLVRALMGARRAERVTREACMRASLTLIEHTRTHEHAALVEHLRLRGELTASFLVRAVAHGKVDFFGSVLMALSSQSETRVRAVLASGRDVAVTALFRAAGLAAPMHGVFLRALKVWREVAAGRRVAGAQEVSWLMLREIESTAETQAGSTARGELAALVKSIHLEVLRENARCHALAIAAA
ncbi:DUF2336 domain-containing protein [Mesorhizobium sp. CAU 1741]|uniref:DUF2336 domain-containing protein n=1 Tax=Mesorhizobium sp. CAU 1741 TaxID=3140366 RepID=UPI00325C1CCF